MQNVQATQVELLMSPPSPAEKARMLHMLTRHHPKFLFRSNARMNYGLTIMNADWNPDNIRIDSACAAGPVRQLIEFHFTLRGYRFPWLIVNLLRWHGWKVNARHRKIFIENTTPWEDMCFSGAWNHDDEPDFPYGWGPVTDRHRQEGTMATMHARLSSL